MINWDEYDAKQLFDLYMKKRREMLHFWTYLRPGRVERLTDEIVEISLELRKRGEEAAIFRFLAKEYNLE